MTQPLLDIVTIKNLPKREQHVNTLVAFPRGPSLSPGSPAKQSTVPIPTKCTVRTVEGSCLLTVVQGKATDDLSPGDSIRIGHPESHDYKISSDLGEKQFFLTEVFHRSHDCIRQNKIDRDREDTDLPCINNCKNGQVCPHPQTRLWKLVPKNKDKRLEWRIRYDDGKVPWKIRYTDTSASHIYFGIKMKWSQIETACRDEDALHYNNLDNAVHQQRLHYFEKVSLHEIIVATYNSVCQWHPIGISIDNVKWAKLARKMKFLSSLKNSNHQVDMAFFHHSCDRKLNMDQFTLVLQDMANLRYPPNHYNSIEALANMLWTTVATLPQVNATIWSRATEMALGVEMIRTCAQIRISAYHRASWQKRLYMHIRHAAIIISKNIRRWSAARRSRWLLKLGEYDWIYRIRYLSAIMCQKVWRGYACALDFTKFQLLRREEERAKRARVWQNLREKERIKKSFLVFKKVLNVQSVLTVTSMILNERQRMDQNTELKIQVYVPQTQRTFSFRLSENEIRECVEKTLVTKGSLSWNEMLGIIPLSKLTTRLMARVVCGRPLILFCRRDIAEKGGLIAKRLVNFDGSLYIVQMYRSPFEIVVRVYDASTCEYLRTLITIPRLIEWLLEDEEEQKKCTIRTMKITCFGRDEDSKNDGNARHPDCKILYDSSDSKDSCNINDEKVPRLIYKEKQSELINWLIKRTRVMYNQESNKLSILLQYECEAEKSEKITRKIQSKWRVKCAKSKAKKMAHLRYEKCFDRTIGAFYYIDIKSGTRQLSKPTLLGNEDIKDPPNEWRITYCNDSDTGKVKKHYINPFTGQTSWLSEEDAALAVQKKFRERQSINLVGTKLDFSQVVKTMTLIKDTEVKFENSPEKLPNRVNFALLCHCIRLDFDKARPIYKDVFAKSPCHPVIARAYGIFILASCEAPQVQTFQKACRLFKESDAADPRQDLFQSAKDHFFHWAVLVHPDNILALLNYALLHQCILKEYNRAEKIYRRALALDPDNSNVVQNFNCFEDQRYPGGYYAGAGVPFSIVERSHVSEDRPEWGEWRRMKDPLSKKANFCHFWVNIIDKSSSFDEPDWDLIWKRRVQRSKRISTSDKCMWVKYHDDKLNTYFVHNQSTGEYNWDQSSIETK